MVRGLSLLLVCWLLSAAVRASDDVPGSRDPAGIARYPRAWIVDYSLEPDVVPREFVVSRVDRIRRDLHVEGLVRPEATAETGTYRIPDGTPLTDVVAHYREAFGGAELFRCSGRACGRSNDWANQIFGRAILYGPDQNQHYLAVERGERLMSVYVIERGNRRIYAHVRVLTPVRTLAREGSGTDDLGLEDWRLVTGLEPRTDGTLPGEADAALRPLLPALSAAGGGPVYVVCHLYRNGTPEELLQRSSRCAEEAVDRLSALLVEAGGDAPELRPFGAGPLLPRTTSRANRLELVLPARAGTQSGRSQ